MNSHYLDVNGFKIENYLEFIWRLKVNNQVICYTNKTLDKSKTSGKNLQVSWSIKDKPPGTLFTFEDKIYVIESYTRDWYIHLRLLDENVEFKFYKKPQ